MPEIESGEWVYHGGNTLYVNCHIQDIPENGADVAHLDAVHGTNLLSGSSVGHPKYLVALFGSHVWKGEWRHATEKDRKHCAVSELHHSVRFLNKFETFRVSVIADQVRRVVFVHDQQRNIIFPFIYTGGTGIRATQLGHSRGQSGHFTDSDSYRAAPAEGRASVLCASTALPAIEDFRYRRNSYGTFLQSLFQLNTLPLATAQYRPVHMTVVSHYRSNVTF